MGIRNDFVIAPIGTVVDSTVVKIEGNVFYLVSLSSRQGTVAPTHFHVIEEMNILSDKQLFRSLYISKASRFFAYI